MKSKATAIFMSVIAAFALWLYVITVVNPESEKTYYEIPVVFQNKEVLAERGLMIVSETPKVTLALKGNRTTLNNLNEANINVITNVANIEKAGTHSLTYAISYPGNVSENEISVLSSSTDLIVLKVENKIKKSIPVVIDYGGSSVPEGFIADLKNAQLDRNYIELSGPESVMQHIHKAIIKVDLTNQTNTLIKDYQYTLCNAEEMPVNASGVTTNAENVSLRIKIQRVKVISLAVNVIYGGGATAQTSTVRIDPLQIRISGSDTLLEDLDELIVGTVNLREISEDATLSFPIVLPEGVTNQTGIRYATVEVKFLNLIKREFSVEKISAINVPEGLEVDMMTLTLPVTVRGPSHAVEVMQESDIVVVVDFANAQIGTSTMNAEIVISSDFSDVGAVGTYQVSATVKVPEQPTNP